jgi:hypothetical protein
MSENRVYEDFMLDSETLGLVPGSIILSVAIVPVFKDIEPLYVKIGVSQSMECGFTQQESTVKWWESQPEHLKTETFSGTMHPRDACIEIASYLSAQCDKKDLKIWAKGVGFDFPILAAYFHKFDMEVPWHYRSPMCYRTIKDVFEYIEEPAFVGTPHSALADATHQARHLKMMFTNLWGWD